MQLQQGNMSMLEYASKFMELSHSAPAFIADERLKMNWFEASLSPTIKERMSVSQYTSYVDLHDTTVNVERAMKEALNTRFETSHTPHLLSVKVMGNKDKDRDRDSNPSCLIRIGVGRKPTPTSRTGTSTDSGLISQPTARKQWGQSLRDVQRESGGCSKHHHGYIFYPNSTSRYFI